MHRAGLLAWRLDTLTETPLTHHSNDLFIAVFATRKDEKHKRPISWPRLANELTPVPPKHKYPKPRHFELISKKYGEWAGFLLDVKHMFHNQLVPPPMRDLFPLQVIAFEDCNSGTTEHLRRTYQAHPRARGLFRPMQKTTPIGFKQSVIKAHYYINSIRL